MRMTHLHTVFCFSDFDFWYVGVHDGGGARGDRHQYADDDEQIVQCPEHVSFFLAL
jgi:hypothetical protein